MQLPHNTQPHNTFTTTLQCHCTTSLYLAVTAQHATPQHLYTYITTYRTKPNWHHGTRLHRHSTVLYTTVPLHYNIQNKALLYTTVHCHYKTKHSYAVLCHYYTAPHSTVPLRYRTLHYRHSSLRDFALRYHYATTQCVAITIQNHTLPSQHGAMLYATLPLRSNTARYRYNTEHCRYYTAHRVTATYMSRNFTLHLSQKIVLPTLPHHTGHSRTITARHNTIPLPIHHKTTLYAMRRYRYGTWPCITATKHDGTWQYITITTPHIT